MKKIISLTGFMGCGKSSTGKALAALMQLPFVDLDEYIEERTGETIPEIFAAKGNDHFRMIEHKCLMELLSGDADSFILALGGGTPCREDNLNALKEHSLCIYLRATERELTNNLEGTQDARPMLKQTSIKSLLEQRIPFYNKAADIIIDVDGKNEDEIASQLLPQIVQMI